MLHTQNMIELERPPITENAILVRLALPSDSEDEIEESLGEMKRLAQTAGARVVCTFVQRRPQPCPATLIGAGKVRQIKVACEEYDADLVLVDSDLTPTQGSKLQEALDTKVLDRTQLILDIFAQRAKTNEGKLQVELAQLQYTLPRLTGRGVEMMRLGAGIGTRGPGEQKLEVDRRVIRRRLAHLQGEIEAIRRHRRLQRKQRNESSVGTVALVGYTNAGKSSLLNALTNADTFVEDKLFATLDPCSRKCPLPGGGHIILTDTVGFIRKLPHSLVAAFRATLEEVVEADVVLLVADASHEGVLDHVKAVNEVLEEIEIGAAPIVRVFNKIDAANSAFVEELLAGPGECLAVSAHTGEGLQSLLVIIERTLSLTRSRVTLRIPQSDAGMVSRVYQQGRVHEQSYDGDSILLDAEIDTALKGIVGSYIERATAS